jgi:hypothetical protein
MLQWFFVQAVMSLAWLIEDGFGADDMAPSVALVNISRQLLA